MRKNFQKTNISYPLIRTPTCAYPGVSNASFSENLAFVLNEWPIIWQDPNVSAFINCVLEIYHNCVSKLFRQSEIKDACLHLSRVINLNIFGASYSNTFFFVQILNLYNHLCIRCDCQLKLWQCTQLIFASSKSTIGTLEKGVKCVQS